MTLQDKQVNNKPERAENGQLLPGNTANPSGRPLKGNAWADIYNSILDSDKIELILYKGDEKEEIKFKTNNQNMRYALGLSLLKAGLEGNVQAIRELADRTTGKPPQGIDITTDGDKISRTPLTKEEELLISEALKNADKSK